MNGGDVVMVKINRQRERRAINIILAAAYRRQQRPAVRKRTSRALASCAGAVAQDAAACVFCRGRGCEGQRRKKKKAAGISKRQGDGQTAGIGKLGRWRQKRKVRRQQAARSE